MTSEPLPAECAEARRRMAEGDTGEASGHLAGCHSCSAFAAALAELDARLARLPVPEPPAGAADRAIAGFRAAVAASGTPGTAPLTPPPPAARPLTLPSPSAGTGPPPPARPLTPPSPSAGTGPPSRTPPARPPRAGHARRRRWRRPASLAAAAAAAITLVVALIAVLGPGSTAPAYAAILREAAAHTGAEKSALFNLSGAIGLSLRGQKITAPLTGTGATEFPDRGKLTEVTTLFGKRLQQDIVSVGNRVWDRANSGPWVLVPIPPDHASPIDQAIAHPAQALTELTRVGSGYRNLGMATISGTRVRQIQLTIPGDSFHAFGNLPQRVSHWTVVVDVSQAGLILRRLSITGHGVVGMLGIQVPFNYSLQLTLRDYGASVSIQPPPGA